MLKDDELQGMACDFAEIDVSTPNSAILMKITCLTLLKNYLGPKCKSSHTFAEINFKLN